MLKILLLSLSCLIASACPPGALEALGNPFFSAYENQRMATLAKLRENYPHISNIEIEITPTPESGYPFSARVFFMEGNKKVVMPETYLNFDTKGGLELTGSVDVHPKYRNAGLNKLLMLAALSKNPQVQRIRDTLTDDNQAIFILAALNPQLPLTELRSQAVQYRGNESSKEGLGIYHTSNKKLLAQAMGLKEKGEVKKFCERIIRAYEQFTPHGKTNQIAGFNHTISMKIVINESGMLVIDTVISEKVGPANTPTEIIFIDVSRGVKRVLSLNGDLQDSLVSFPE